MDVGLLDKKAMVVGGSRGIGKDIAWELAREGMDVVVSARGVEDLERAAREIGDDTGRKVIPMPMDATRREQVDRVVAEAASQLGGCTSW